MKNEKKLNVEIYHLRKGFNALTIDYQKGVLRTAQGLLRIQRGCKTMVAENMQYVSPKRKNGNN